MACEEIMRSTEGSILNYDLLGKVNSIHGDRRFMINKLALGSANFGLRYGLAGKKNLISTEITKILDYGQKQGIWGVDTAQAYGKSERIIGNYFKKKEQILRIVTKLPVKEYTNSKSVEQAILKSLESLKMSSIDYLLIHSYETYKRYGKIIMPLLKSFRENKVIGCYGVSVYFPWEANEFARENDDDIALEFPVNLFDQRFLKSNLLKELKKQGHFLFARSVFLQGLLFFHVDQLNGVFLRVKEKIRKLREISEEYGFSLAGLALLFVLTNPHIDITIIGVDGLEQLKGNLKSLKNEEVFIKYQQIKDRISDLEVTDEEIILPFRWAKS